MQRRAQPPNSRQLSLFQEETVSVQWAAEYLGCSVMTVLRYVEAGFIQGYQMCDRGWWRLLKASIFDYEKTLRSKVSMVRQTPRRSAS
jgi:excisionase family DNA binding protein